MLALSLLAQDSNNSGGSPATLLIFLLIPVAMYFLMIRPQRKRMKETAAMQSSIGIGDEVVTNSGIFGFITGVDGDKFWLEIDDDVQIRIAKAAIASRINDSGDAPAPELEKGSKRAKRAADDSDES
jgi:preprotein translocase subunit YajC